MVAAAATRGNVLVKNVIPKHLESITAKLVECGVNVEEYDDAVRVSATGRAGKCNIKTMPHPGFPTDMQPQFAVLLSIAKGTSIISESVWDNRFRYAEQLSRMGAQIHVNGKTAVIEGVEGLKGAPIKADDLRAGAAMMIAGLVATALLKLRIFIISKEDMRMLLISSEASELIFRGKNFRMMTKRFKWAQAEKNRSLLYGRLRFKL